MENPQQICSTVHDHPDASRELPPCARTFAGIIVNFTPQTQDQSRWKAVENLDNLHAAKTVHRAADRTGTLHHHRRLILLVRPFEVRNLVIALKMPDSRRHLVDQIVIVGDQQHRTVKTLQRNIQRVDRF